MSGPPVVAIVHLGSRGSLGGRNRVNSLRAIFEAAGAAVCEVPLLVDHRLGLSDLRAPGGWAVLRADAVPEAMAWSARSVLAHLERLQPSLVVCVTARAFRPELLPGAAGVVLDYVDRLSVSYRDRATIVGRSAWAPLFSLLARSSARFERRPLPPAVRGIAAGWADAQALGLTWIPNTVPPAPLVAETRPDHDLLFLGKLSYPPNVEAVENLARVWSRLSRRRPGTTLVLAGASPTPAVHALARSMGWTVIADFDDLADVVPRIRVAVAPLDHASGIQGKVLSSAAYGVPQVLSPVAVAGFAPGFPCRLADGDDQLVDAIAGLLDDDDERHRLGTAARDTVAETYHADRWAGWASEVLQGRAGDGAA